LSNQKVTQFPSETQPVPTLGVVNVAKGGERQKDEDWQGNGSIRHFFCGLNFVRFGLVSRFGLVKKR
jgi:hypothetical protein